MRLFGYEIRKVKDNVTCLHPEVKAATEFAFEIDGKEFYTFKNLLDMPAPRYQRIQEFIREAEMRITSTDLLDLLGLVKDAINKGKITDAVIFVNSIENLASQFIETDTFYRLFTCLFFDLDEDITDYDFDYNEYKIALFKSQPKTSFFFSQPMKKYLPQIDISQEDLEVFLKLTSTHHEYITKNKERLHQKYVDSKERYLWSVSSYDILKYQQVRKLSIINYYIYVENIEAERQRQQKRNKK